MSDKPAGKKRGNLAELEEQLERNLTTGATLHETVHPGESAVAVAPKTKAPTASVAKLRVEVQALGADGEHVVPTGRGMVRADLPVPVSLKIPANARFEFRQLLLEHGLSYEDAFMPLINAAIATHHVFTEEELLWLAEQNRQ